MQNGDGGTAETPVYLQVGLDVRGHRCLVVGGGAVARRKLRALIEAGAAVTVVALEAGTMPEGVIVERRGFREDDLDGALLVMAATDDRDLNAHIAATARRRGIWANVADNPQASTLVLPAVVRRGVLRVAVSTGNGSPALARRLRQRLEEQFGPEYGELAGLLGRLREEWEPRALDAGVAQNRRRAAWHAVLDQPLVELLHEGLNEEAAAIARGVLDSYLKPGAKV